MASTAWRRAARRTFAGVLVPAFLGLGLTGQRQPAELLAGLRQDAAVKAALDAARRGEARVLEDQAAITAIPAPPFGEAARAAAMKAGFEAVGLQNVRVDAAGNVIGERPGASRRPNLVVAAHLDTVFPTGTDVSVRREGRSLAAPGIGDDGRGLALLLGIARALDEGQVRTPGTITFVANVGEEGLGDLRGTKELFERTLKGQVDAFLSIDGSGHGITNTAVGSRRYRVTFRGPGGHSFGAFGLVNPLHALGRAVARIAEFRVPAVPRVTFNVGRVGGGTSVNAIPQEAWFEIDMRSSDGAALAALDARFRRTVDEAVRDENARWTSGRIVADTIVVGERPAGRTPDTSPIVRTAVAVNLALGLAAELTEGSTDANVPISLGVPAITVGGGGRSSGAHSLAERFDTTESSTGTERVLLLVVALAR